jgi:hypothetical protein
MFFFRSNTLRYFIILFLFYTFFLLNLSAQSQNIPTNGLIAYWPFNGNALDESGNNNNGIVTGASLTTDRYGNQKSAYYFDSEDFIEINDSAITPFNGDFTISFWFKSDHLERMEPLNFKDSFWYNQNLNFSFNDQYAFWVYWNSGGFNGIRFGESGELVDNKWHNLILIRKGSKLSLFIDGVLKGHTYYSLPIGSQQGMKVSSKKHPWIGSIDDITIYNRAFTDSEIKYISNFFQVLFPTQKDEFPIKSNLTIKWSKPLNPKKLKIEYSVYEGTEWTLLVDDIDSEILSYNWQVPPYPGRKCLIKISDEDNIFCISDTFTISKYEWVNESNNSQFYPRDGAGAVVLNDEMFLIGGWNPTYFPLNTTNEIWKSSDGKNWELLTIAPFEPRHCFGSAVFNGKIWVLGGDQNQCHFQPDVWSSEDGINWIQETDFAPWGERAVHMYSVFDDKLWVMGGQKTTYCGNNIEAYYNDVWNSVDGINWNLVTDSAQWQPRGQIEGNCVFNNQMWILGGGTIWKDYFSDVWNSSDGENWTLIKEFSPWKKRQYHSIAVYDSAMWILGGHDGKGDLNDVWFTPNGTDWKELKNTPWPSRHATSTFNHNGSLWVVAGFLWNDAWRLNIFDCAVTASSPKDQYASLQDTAIFISSYPSESATYQWQINNGNGWEIVEDTSRFTGINSDTLRFFNFDSEDYGSRYRCIITSGICSDTSSSAFLFNCPSFELHPLSQNVPINSNLYLSVDYSLSHGTYQWQTHSEEGWINIIEANSNILSFDSIGIDFNNKQFRCIGYFENCIDTSEIASIHVVCPEITAHPQDVVIRERETARFEIEYPLINSFFKWQVDNGGGWVTISDSTNGNFMLVHDVSMENNNMLIRCIAYNDYCGDTSATAILKVCPTIITTQPTDQILNTGETAFFSIEYPFDNVFFKWQKNNGNGWITIADSGNNFILIPEVNLEINNSLYRCIVYNGYCTDTSATAILQVCPTFLSQPTDPLIMVGDTAIFNFEFSSLDVNYQWQVRTKEIEWVNIPNATDNSLHISPDSEYMDGGIFRCIVSTGICQDTSNMVKILFDYTSNNEIEGDIDVVIYPNPFKGFVNLVFKNNKDQIHYHYSIFNISAQKIMEGQFLNKSNLISLEHFNPGVYFIKIENQENFYRLFKLIKL